ncbi:MAG: amino acid decarboxylase [Planctomycetia bacterium]|nr:MAG: amino acid decarboxylase [Planctomycetia bacterium]
MSDPLERPPLGDLPTDEFRRALHRAADLIADYVDNPQAHRVTPRLAPGGLRALLPPAPPAQGEALDALLDDYQSLIVPNSTHWNHPGFLAYFANSATAPGILGEMLAAALNVNAMLWRTGPAATELEEHVCDWLRQMMDLPPEFRGHINDTASISSLLALAAARQRVGDPSMREAGMSGRSDLPRLTVYASDQAHSSIDKALITLGLGLNSLRRVPVDDAFQMIPAALAERIDADRQAGMRPFAVVATAGSTSTTSIDPLERVAEVARSRGVWLHVDAAYAGSAAICPEIRARMAGMELGDSIVVNPHKWLFTPVDCSVLFLRDPESLRAAFALTPDYLKTTEAGVTNLMDYGPQLGRRFRALKLWMVIRGFGVEGLRARIRRHVELAQEFRGWVAADPRFEICAPSPLSVVCFRLLRGATPEVQDAANDALLASVNADGAVLLSSTRLRGRVVLRVAIGNVRTEREHVHRAWELILAGAGGLPA